MTAAAIRLSARVRAGLNAARGISACYVVLHHVTQPLHLVSPLLTVPFRFGQEAVLVFFLLSGFVIFANERERAADLTGYVRRRVLRIYPTLLAAMLVSALVALDNGNLAARARWSEFFGTLLAAADTTVGHPGSELTPFLGNTPLWSLSYELAFYALFPLVLRLWLVRPAMADHLIGTVSCAAFLLFVFAPNHWALVFAYFSIWWCGAMAADAYLRGVRTIGGILRPLSWGMLLTALAGLVVLHDGFRGAGDYPFLIFRHFGMSMLFLMVFFGPLGRMVANRAVRAVVPASFLASISYGLYVLHWPLLIQWDRVHTGLGLAFGVVLLFLLSWLLDDRLHRLTLRLFRWMMPEPARSTG